MAHRVISRERDIQVAFGAKLTSTGGQYWRARSQMNPKATLARLSWTGRSASGGETAMTLEVLQSKLIERVNRVWTRYSKARLCLRRPRRRRCLDGRRGRREKIRTATSSRRIDTLAVDNLFGHFGGRADRMHLAIPSDGV